LKKGDESSLENIEKAYSELAYTMPLDEFKNIPFLPKSCRVTEKINAYFCDPKTIIIIKDVFTAGVPASDA